MQQNRLSGGWQEVFPDFRRVGVYRQNENCWPRTLYPAHYARSLYTGSVRFSHGRNAGTRRGNADRGGGPVAGSTINKTITVGVTLGSTGYASPLTITAVGEIAPIAAGVVALYADLTAGRVLNHGHITGGGGSAGTYTSGSNFGLGGAGGGGGKAVYLKAGSLTNDGTIGRRKRRKRRRCQRLVLRRRCRWGRWPRCRCRGWQRDQ